MSGGCPNLVSPLYLLHTIVSSAHTPGLSALVHFARRTSEGESIRPAEAESTVAHTGDLGGLETERERDGGREGAMERVGEVKQVWEGRELSE